MEFIVINIAMTLYVCIALYQIYRYRTTMADGAYHHLLSHLYIVLFSLIAINLYVFKGYVYPMIFAALHILQHASKENLRLIKTNKWTPSVKEEF